MKRLQIPEGLRTAARVARKAHWTIVITKSQHLKWTSPSGDVFITSSTPSDRRGIKNHLARLRGAGLRV